MKERQAPEGSWVYRSWTTPTCINSRFNCRFDGESLIKRPLFWRDNVQSAIQTLVSVFYFMWAQRETKGSLFLSR